MFGELHKLAFEDALPNDPDGDSLGVFDGDDYKTLMEMEEFKSQVFYIAQNRPDLENVEIPPGLTKFEKCIQQSVVQSRGCNTARHKLYKYNNR